jgi:signal transduction histidine kinase
MNPVLLSKLSEIRNVSIEHARNLQDRRGAKDPSEQQWMSSVLRELEVAHEELRIVEEEVQSQSEELSASYAALEYERRRYRELFHDAPAPYLVTDGTGIVLEANRLAGRLLNTDPHVVIGKPLAVYIWDGDWQVLLDVLALGLCTSEILKVELQLKPHEAAMSIRAMASVRRECTQAGVPCGLRWILHERDFIRMVRRAPAGSHGIEPRPLAEDRVQQLEHELARETLKRTAAEKALEQRNARLAFVAHELRNPLNSAAGWLEIMNQTDAGVASREHILDVLKRNIKTLGRMVEELVDQTRVVQGLVVLECQRIDCRALLEQVCDDARGLAHAKHLNFTCEIDESIGLLRCDAYRLQQALNNVLGNAIKFAPSDHGAVRLTAKFRCGMLECTVSDSGPGISREHLDTIFEPFIRVGACGTSTGLGLGLSIARKLIELHGGSLTAESEGIGQGATFLIQVPVAGPGPMLAAAPKHG